MSQKKTVEQIAKMRRAGLLVWEAHRLAAGMVRPGVTTGEIDAAVEALIVSRGAVSLFKGVPGTVPFPAATCISVNEVVVHGIPSEIPLKEGDIIGLDFGVIKDEWHADGAWTYPVGDVSSEAQRLLNVSRALAARTSTAPDDAHPRADIVELPSWGDALDG